ncbi:MAG: MBL fold metallo-hydrolase [Deltaproteobacteria bacterium]|nr:MBL fold metallo-hydrolase [Deltaproteobacteria bacterium]
MKEEFDKLAPGPVLALIYTHTHPDHLLAASVFHEEGRPIIAGSRAPESLDEQFASFAPTLRRRGAQQFGEGLARADLRPSGIGPALSVDPGPVPPILYPTRTVKGREVFPIGGTALMIQEAPGETRDQIFVYLPERGVLLPGDNIYKAFPNLYAPRGVPPRPVREWIASLDIMRGLGPEYLVPSHTEPVAGKRNVDEILTAYRDAIAFVHDSVIRKANEAMDLEDMVEAIELPPHLKNHPWLAETYGKVSWSVRGIHEGYLGWFDGNATRLDPTHPRERAERLVALAGGREKILAEARAAQERGDAQWAAELCDELLALNADDPEARAAKADALEKLGRETGNANARHFYLTSALDLRGEYKGPGKPEIDDGTVRDLPIGVIIRSFPERLDPKKTADIVKTIGFTMTDTGETFTFIIRRGVGEVRDERAESPDLSFSATESDFKSFLIGTLSPAVALAGGRVKFSGGLDELIAFKSYLIQP